MKDAIYFLCNEGDNLSVSTTKIKPVYCYEDWEMIAKNLHKTDLSAIIIVAELAWEGISHTQMLGFDLIYEIRVRCRFSCPVIITSNLTKEELGFTSFKGKARFWKDPSLSYVPLSDLIIYDYSSICQNIGQELDANLYQDLCESVYHYTGFIEDEIHDLEIRLREYPENTENHLIAFFDYLTPSLFQFKSPLTELMESTIGDFRQSKYVSIQKLREQLLNIVEYDSLQESQEEEVAVSGEILYIDDDREEKVIDILIQGGFIVHHVENKKDAIDLLKADERNKITVVICNYRFYDKNKRFQWDQGYHILNAIAELPNIVSFITLTSYHRSNLAKLTSKHRKKVIPLFKQDILSPKQPNGLLSLLSLVSKENALIQKQIIELASFPDEFLVYYKMHRDSKEYEMEEKQINKQALNLIEKVLCANGNQIPEFPSYAFQGKLNKKNIDDSLSNFRIKLLGRRVAIGLCQLERFRTLNKKSKWLTIGSILRTGWVETGDERGLTTLINTNLNLSQKKNYLWESLEGCQLSEEERNWLNTHGNKLASLS